MKPKSWFSHFSVPVVNWCLITPRLIVIDDLHTITRRKPNPVRTCALTVSVLAAAGAVVLSTAALHPAMMKNMRQGVPVPDPVPSTITFSM
jgi:hypothetical protein